MNSSSTKKSRSKGKVTLSDVAKALNISSITVSRALNTPEKVSKNVLRKIQHKVAELGYIPNRAAKLLATNKTNTIAVVIPSISNTVFSNVIKGIYDVCTPNDFDIFFANTYYSIQKEQDLINKLLTQHPDGMIITGLDLSDATEKTLRNANIPIVQIMETGYKAPIDMNVGISHFDAGKLMADYLINKQYKHIGFIGAQMDFRSQRRMNGFLAAFDQVNPNTTSYTLTTNAPSSVKLGGELMADILSQYPQLDAVFCNNDDIAYGAIFECQRRKLKIPEQIAISGFNDLGSSACINPSLTTIKTPLYEMGRTAAQMLLNSINNIEITDPIIDMGVKLQARNSA
jgi:LacI family gluconate utilization system Gnt-I transcriptional repressor